MFRFFSISSVTVVISFCALVFIPSFRNDANPLFIVEPGETIKEVAYQLAEQDFIHSPSLFIAFVKCCSENVVHMGSYVFDSKTNLISIARQITTPQSVKEKQEVRILEGSNIQEIVETIVEVFPSFDVETFKTITKGREGHLYPDTYAFTRGVAPHPRIMLHIMEKTFEKKVTPYKEIFQKGEYKPLETFEDVINLAAIVELEATDDFDRRQIARVLLNRLKKGMPLQVDVSFRAINGKNTFSLSTADLKIDHPLNTYTNVGLPEYPIGNPSVASIDAVLRPAKTNALYFLADRQGNTYFSNTHEEHIRKKTIYLR